MKMYWESGGIATRILYLGTRLRWVVSFTPRPFHSQGMRPGIHCIESCVGPKPVWTQWWRGKLPAPAGNRIPVVQPVAQSHDSPVGQTEVNSRTPFLCWRYVVSSCVCAAVRRVSPLPQLNIAKLLWSHVAQQGRLYATCDNQMLCSLSGNIGEHVTDYTIHQVRIISQ